jgi:hypothetical protein
VTERKHDFAELDRTYSHRVKHNSIRLVLGWKRQQKNSPRSGFSSNKVNLNFVRRLSRTACSSPRLSSRDNVRSSITSICPEDNDPTPDRSQCLGKKFNAED